MKSQFSKENLAELIKLKDNGHIYHRESETLEFKEQFNLASNDEYFRDFAAFANNKGGYLVFGVKDSPYELVGLSEKSLDKFSNIDAHTISRELLNAFSPNISWEHHLFNLQGKNFAVFCIDEAKIKPVISKSDFGKNNRIKQGEIYYRYRGRTQKIEYPELEYIINERIEASHKQWQDVISKMAKIGAPNLALFDLNSGKIEKGNNVLVVDEKTVKNVQWIKEGEFNEKDGAKTLKLIGDVQPVSKVEIFQRDIQNILHDYPLSAKKLNEAVRKNRPDIRANKVWDIIRDNGIKEDKRHSYYNFRNADELNYYEKNGVLPKTTPSLYKQSTINLIINLFDAEQ